MKGHTSTYVTLNEISAKALHDLLESSHRKEQFLMWALDYYRKLRMDIAREVKTVTLSMTPWKSVILPDDCVDWIAVGIKSGELIKTFVNDNRIAPRSDAQNNEEPSVPTFDNVDLSAEGVVFYNFTEYGEDAGKLYGQLIKNNGLGYFNPNQHQGVNEIQFSASVPAGTSIYMMYLSTLFDPTRDSVVHPYAEDFIRYGIHYENLKHKQRNGGRVTSDMIRIAKQELDDELCQLVERRADWNTESIIEASREAYRLTPKR
jgi:hypothetical protein